MQMASKAMVSINTIHRGLIMKCIKSLSVLALVLATTVAGLSQAATSFTVVNGVASDNRPQNGQVDFTFNNTYTDLKVTLTNTAGVGQLSGITSVLDGVSFSLSGVLLSALTLNTSFADASFNPNGTVSCASKDDPCTWNSAPVSVNTAGWKFDSSTGKLAPDGYKPYGIVNSNLVSYDGIPNIQHNPYLNGPVTFDFAIANSGNVPITVTSANLYFGTGPDIRVAVPVPEPQTYALMLAGLGLVGFAARRRKAA